MKRLFKIGLSLFVVILMLEACGVQAKENNFFCDFPERANPERIGELVTQRFLSQWHSQYGSPLRVNEPRTQITYPDVCTWLGGLWFSQNTENEKLLRQLQDRFLPLWDEENYLMPIANHVDNNVFGALALELHMINREERYKNLGMMYADAQWDLSFNNNRALLDSLQDEKIIEEAFEWDKKGYSWQTRLWLDDMFMITTIQAQAYRVTGDEKYLNRAAREMVLYLERIQLENGLFNHAPSAPFAWGRANGWMAFGFVELLRALPQNNVHRDRIMEGFLQMMSTLKILQGDNGMWKQVVDDPTMWDETSGTAMFTYAMIIGVQNGWLDEQSYGAVARKAWIALSDYVEANGDIRAVCEGTMLGNTSEHYRNRKALTGDLHGQAPVLWCANALINN